MLKYLLPKKHLSFEVQFQGTAALLFKDDNQTGDVTEQIHEGRYRLFDKLCEFFPKGMVQPKENLFDLMPL